MIWTLCTQPINNQFPWELEWYIQNYTRSIWVFISYFKFHKACAPIIREIKIPWELKRNQNICFIRSCCVSIIRLKGNDMNTWDLKRTKTNEEENCFCSHCFLFFYWNTVHTRLEKNNIYIIQLFRIVSSSYFPQMLDR